MIPNQSASAITRTTSTDEGDGGGRERGGRVSSHEQVNLDRATDRTHDHAEDEDRQQAGVGSIGLVEQEGEGNELRCDDEQSRATR